MAAGSVPGVSGRGSSKSDEVDFEIRGQEMQFVEIELDPGESAIAEAGSMMFKDASVHMDTIFGDGTQQDSGILGKIWTAGKRVLTDESLFNNINQTSANINQLSSEGTKMIYDFRQNPKKYLTIQLKLF